MESNEKLEQLLRQMYAQESPHNDDIDTSDIIDEEWTKFEAEHFSENGKHENGSDSNPSTFQPFNSIKKIAAMFVGVLMLSGIAFAAIRVFGDSSQKAHEEQTVATASDDRLTPNAQMSTQTGRPMTPVVYEDAELATILSDIAVFHQCELVYKQEASKHIRLYFTWNKKMPIDDIIDTFNKFERIHITRDNKKLIVE